MSEERSMILRMLKDEKISLEEAEALLEVLDEEGKEPGFDHAPSEGRARQEEPQTGRVAPEDPVPPDRPAPSKRPETTSNGRRSSTADDSGSNDAGLGDREAAGDGESGKQRRRSGGGVFWDISGLKESIRATVDSVKETVRSALESVPEDIKDIHIDIEGELKRAFGNHQAEKTLSASESTDGIERISVECAWGDFEVVGRSGDTIEVAAEVIAFGDTDENARRLVDEVSLRVVRNGSALAVGVDPGDLKRRLRADIEIRLPSDLPVALVNKSGDISVEGTGAVYAGSASGNITCTSITGDVSAESKSGSIEVKDVAGALTAESYSGDVRCERIAGATRLTTKSGDIKGGDLADAVTFTSLSGDVRLENVAGLLNGSTVSGDINIEVPDSNRRLELTSTAGDVEVDGEVDPGGELLLRLSTVSGDINVELKC